MQQRSLLQYCKIVRLSCQLFIVIAFILLSLYLVPYHEHWADEVQAWLIAKEASFGDIITKIGHSEGHPVLWHLLLKSVFLCFGSEINISYISIAVMSMTVMIIVFFYDIPLIYKLLLPFGYYFLYQYNIVARNYCLGYLALAILGVIYPKRFKSPYLYVCSLFFLAASVNFYAPVALCIGARWCYEVYKSAKIKDFIFPLGLLGAGGILLLWHIFPVTAEYDITIHYFPPPVLIAKRFITAFTGWDNLIYLFLFAFAVGLYSAQEKFYTALSKNIRVILFIVLCFLPFILLRYRFYHSGLIYGLFLCLAYMFFRPHLRDRQHPIFLIILIMQIYQSAVSISYDKMFLYSPQNLVIEALKRHHKENNSLQILGYHALPVFSVLGKNHPVWRNDIPHYYKWEITDFQHIINRYADILVVSDDYVNHLQYDFSYYDNPDKFYIYHFNIRPILSENLLQPLSLYIRKD